MLLDKIKAKVIDFKNKVQGYLGEFKFKMLFPEIEATLNNLKVDSLSFKMASFGSVKINKSINKGKLIEVKMLLTPKKVKEYQNLLNNNNSNHINLGDINNNSFVNDFFPKFNESIKKELKRLESYHNNYRNLNFD